MKRYLCAAMIGLGIMAFAGYSAEAGKHKKDYYDKMEYTDDYGDKEGEYEEHEEGNYYNEYNGNHSGKDESSNDEEYFTHTIDEDSQDSEKCEGHENHETDEGYQDYNEGDNKGDDEGYFTHTVEGDDLNTTPDNADDIKGKIDEGDSKEFQLAAKAMISSDHIVVLISVGYNGTPLDFLPDDHFATDTNAQISYPDGVTVEMTDFKNVGRGYYQLTLEASEMLDGIDCIVFPIEVDCPDSGLSGRIILEMKN